MATKPYKWRTSSTSCVYVDSNTGSDIFGDGTQTNPYQSLGKAWRGHTAYHPSTIVCRGTFCEDMSDGLHSTTIQGDYYGAATFDGNAEFTLYGFMTPNMIFVNCSATTYSSAGIAATLLVGVGRAVNSNVVGFVNDVYGVAASSVLLRASGLYMGAIGGSSAAKFVCVASPICNETYKLYYTTYSSNSTVTAFSVFDVPKNLRQLQRNNRLRGTLYAWIFGKCAINTKECLTFQECFFASDCEFYDADTNETIEIQGATSEERQAWLNAYIEEKGYTDTQKSIFKDCVFSDKTSYEVYNDPDNGDLSLRWDTADEEVMPHVNNYRGAMPPALHIPVRDNSDGVPATWDEHTVSGLLRVADNKVMLTEELDATRGEILSKVLVTNPDKISISGLFAQYASKYQNYGVRASSHSPEGEKYYNGATLPEGRYIARNGAMLCDDTYISEGGIIVVTSEGATLTIAEEEQAKGAYASEILDSNTDDCMYLRTCPTAYATPKATDGLQKGATYLNIYNKPITYRGRTIVQNESFVAENDDDTFVCEGDADYRIGAIFDDSRVPSQPWIPAAMWGEYFAGKVGNVYQTDSEGEYLGSGNYLCYFNTANGGYSQSLVKQRAQARYIQLKFCVRRLSATD